MTCEGHVVRNVQDWFPITWFRQLRHREERIRRKANERRGDLVFRDVTDGSSVGESSRTYVGIYGHRAFWPDLQGLISDALAHATGNQPQLLTTEAGRETLKQIPRAKRHLIFVESMTSQYFANLADASSNESASGGRGNVRPMGNVLRPGAKPAAAPVAASQGRGFRVVLNVRTPMDKMNAASTLMNRLMIYIRDERNNENKDVLKIASATWTTLVDTSTAALPGRKPVRRFAKPKPRLPGVGEGTAEQDEGPKNPSILFPDEDISNDTRLTITLMVEIMSDGTQRAEPRKTASTTQ